MTVDAHTCPVCGAHLGQGRGDLPCAPTCVPVAEDELRDNVAALRRGTDARTRAELIRRNARLMAVLLHRTRLGTARSADRQQRQRSA